MTNPVRKHIPTSAQIQQEQKERADREREARLAAGQKVVAPQPAAKQPQDEIERLTGQVVAPAKATSVAVPDTRTPQQAYLDEIAPPSSLVGRPIKFDGKAGKWLFSDTDEEIDPNTDFIALCDEILIGWIKFNGKGERPDRIQGLLYDGFIMPPESTLPDRDRSKWELGLSGEPEDPWLHQMCLVLQSPGTHELGTFATTNRTGRRAIGNLLRHYDRLRRKDDDHYPVVRLKVSGYNHPDERVGWVHTPVFAVVGKVPKASAAIPDTSLSGDMNDEIPDFSKK
jgi:hypothetical protein